MCVICAARRPLLFLTILVTLPPLFHYFCADPKETRLRYTARTPFGSTLESDARLGFGSDRAEVDANFGFLTSITSKVHSRSRAIPLLLSKKDFRFRQRHKNRGQGSRA